MARKYCFNKYNIYMYIIYCIPFLDGILLDSVYAHIHKAALRTILTVQAPDSWQLATNSAKILKIYMKV